jgi:nucleobase:cation symporter-1, NCS1 family
MYAFSFSYTHRSSLSLKHSSRHLFTAKAIFVLIAGITFFIWAIVKAKGVGPIIRQPAMIHGSGMSWAMAISLMNCISNLATLVV